jgi:purine-binding chemotaxis protein CheW
MAAPTETGERKQYLSFVLAGADYAVGILTVKEILQYETLTRVPTTPASVRGVLNLRGAVVPVVDLAVKFGLPETAITRLTCVLIVEVRLEGEPTIMGIMADSVSEVIEFSDADVEPAPAFGTQVRVDFLHGMGKLDKKFVLLLDLDRVISASEKELAARINEEATTPPPLGGAPASAQRPTI